jgi:hypothetical protein
MFDQDEPYHPFYSKGVIAWIAAGVLGLVFGGYALHEHHVAQDQAAQNAQLQTALNTTHSQLDQLTATVNSLAAQQQQAQQPAPQPAAAPAAKPTAVHGGNGAGGPHRHAVDSRYAKLKAQLDAQGKEIDDTRNDLSSTRTELTGSIAKTHDELVVLEKRGERNYFEFDIDKSKQFTRSGEMGIRLRKANDKHQYADLDLLVDDRNLTQKHVNLYQPVMFYTPDSPQPVELVVNNISKNHIHGYVSISKYRQSELAAMSNANAQSNGNTDANSDTQPQRQKLTVPQQ